MYFVHLDKESQSKADITKVGAKIYAEDPSTDLMCLIFAKNDEHPTLMTLADIRSKWNRLRELAADPEAIFVAHNAYFERSMWTAIMVKRYGYPEIPRSRWRCTMAMSLAHGLPAALDDALWSLHAPYQKDMEGYAVMMKLCKPNSNGVFWTIETALSEFNRLHVYCMGDVEGERWLHKRLRPLSDFEQAVWEIDQRINDEGIYIDTPAVMAAVVMAEHHKKVVHAAFRGFTHFQFKGTTLAAVDKPSQRERVKNWLNMQEGIKISNTRKHTIAALLSRDDLSDNVFEAIEALKESAKTSVAKYKAMLNRSKNGLLREILRYYGAHTGRWTGQGVQTHNMAREDATIEMETCINAFTEWSYDLFRAFYPDVSKALSVCTRGVIVSPPGSRMFISDFAQIEARVLAWLAGQQDKLDMFINHIDLYCVLASVIFGYEVTKKMAERQAGKVGDLSLGYQGGIGAYATMSSGYGVNLNKIFLSLWASTTPQERESAEHSYEYYLSRPVKKGEVHINRDAALAADIIKQRWRAANPHIVQYWHSTNAAAIEAVLTGKPVQCGDIWWFCDDIFLYAKLPSGRCMAYPYPSVVGDERGKPKLRYWGKIENQWGWVYTYGGKLVENLVQAISRDLLAESMVRMEHIYPWSFHTHDEGAANVAEGTGNLVQFDDLMKARSNWAKDIPIETDTWETVRYGKAG